MRDLRINPQDHEIELVCLDSIGKEDASVNINIKLGSDVGGQYPITKKEAAAMGKWFTELAKKLK